MYPPAPRMRNQLREIGDKIGEGKSLSTEDQKTLLEILRGLVDEVESLRYAVNGEPPPSY